MATTAPTVSATQVVAALSALNTSSDLLRTVLAVQLRIAPIDLRALFLIAGTSGIGPSDLGHRLGLTTGSMTALVDRLEAKGFVARERHQTDRRSIVVRVTPAGDHAQQWASEHYVRAVATQLDAVDAAPEVLIAFLTGLGADFDAEAERVSAS